MESYVTISGLLALGSFIVGFYFSSKGQKRQDEAAMKAEVESKTRMWDKLEEICRDTKESKDKLNSISNDLAELKQKNSVMTSRIDGVEKRLNIVEKNLEKLHQDYRKHIEESNEKER